ncbi:DMT family transporter [Paenibacillus macquariensis]|uniref:EamA-like transporter family protein n=1 Tax=Paenibacillus macquariensis TaxID=948756 RepID=A0ABY1KC23_9BACL|nr:DMT family transporter [Paenibacillus macquariensis]MEC0089593.1 DMT family transporter [Paenibacillus macquariensis]OAB30915.1 ligand-binding protein SH3 [Paenibacillus macquariensis subsp. macquariensis]SIR58171.1 EamA-like transporter family protein [Paenibacillus macquariensis]
MHIISVLLVLVSGISHALWNLLTKRSENKQLFLCIIFIPSTVLLLPPFLKELANPNMSAQGYILLVLSMIIQGGYAHFLVKSLTHGDLSQVYPMMRGISTFLLPLVSVLFLNETLSVWGWIGLMCIVTGFVMTSGLIFMKQRQTIPFKVILYTVGVGFCTMSYVLVDKINLQHFSPIALLEASNIGFMLGLMPHIKFKKVNWSGVLKKNAVLIGVGSILSPGSYFLFLLALNLSPLTYIAPLREIGTVIGTLAGIYLLHEKKELVRIVSASIIFIGIVLIGFLGI